MKIPYHSTRARQMRRTWLTVHGAMCLMLLLLTPALQAQTARLTLTAVSVDSSKISLAWKTNIVNPDSFQIRRGAFALGPFKRIAGIDKNKLIYLDRGLKANTEYFYAVSAYKGGSAVAGDSAHAKTLPLKPAPPSGLIAIAVNGGQINLTWKDNAGNEEGFKIEGKIGPPDKFVELATVGANLTSYAVTGLNTSTQYLFRVRAFNADGNSPYSNVAHAMTLPRPPVKPHNLMAKAVSSNQINLAWTDSSDSEAGFKIECKIGLLGGFVEMATVGANVTHFEHAGLKPNTKYSYRVRAFNAGGNSPYSNVANAATISRPPLKPIILVAQAVSSSQINLAWKDSSNNETGFKIERKTDPKGGFVEIATVGANLTGYVNTELLPGTKYFYRVRAFNAGGLSLYSNVAQAVTLPLPPVKPISLFARAVGSSRIDLAWADSAKDETGFKIERKIDLKGEFVEIATVGAEVKIYANTGLTPKTKYFYRVRAFNTGGNSAYSNVVMAMTMNGKAPAAAADSLLKTADNAVIPEGIHLAQNYPNPFNPATMISYSLSAGTNVTLKVINVAGQEVATLVDDYQDRGIHRVTFNGRKLPSGVYYAVMKAGETTQTKRMVLAK